MVGIGERTSSELIQKHRSDRPKFLYARRLDEDAENDHEHCDHHTRDQEDGHGCKEKAFPPRASQLDRGDIGRQRRSAVGAEPCVWRRFTAAVGAPDHVAGYVPGVKPPACFTATA